MKVQGVYRFNLFKSVATKKTYKGKKEDTDDVYTLACGSNTPHQICNAYEISMRCSATPTPEGRIICATDLLQRIYTMCNGFNGFIATDLLQRIYTMCNGFNGFIATDLL